MLTEQITVTYENEEHRRYADLLIRNGFEMSILPNFKIGLTFRHSQKLHLVELQVADDPVEGYFEPTLRILMRPHINIAGQLMLPSLEDYDVPVYPEDYSEFEWRELSADKPDNFTFLERELYLWLKIRPHSLNSQLRIV